MRLITAHISKFMAAAKMRLAAVVAVKTLILMGINMRKAQTPKGNSSTFKFIPTWKLQAILENPYCVGVDGCDYHPYKEELESILFERLNRLQAWELRKALAARLEVDVLESLNSVDVLESLEIPPHFDVDEFYTCSNGFSTVLIPKIIMSF